MSGRFCARRDRAGIALDLAAPVLGTAMMLEHAGRALPARSVRVGNPNLVVFVESVADVDLPTLARVAREAAGPANLDAVPHDPVLRRELEALPAAEVFARLESIDPDAAALARGNSRRAVRYLEIATLAGPVAAVQRRGPPLDAVRIGLSPPREMTNSAIATRVRSMIDAGVLDETRALVARGLDPTLPSMTGHGYVHWAAHLRGALSLEDAVARTVRDTVAYARRQMTWFRRDPLITWYDPTQVDPLPRVLEAAR